MKDISSFFEKFKALITHESFQREKIASVIGEVLSVRIEPQTISIKNGTAHVSGSSVLRNEIFMRRHTIIEKLKNTPGTSGIREVR